MPATTFNLPIVGASNASAAVMSSASSVSSSSTPDHLTLAVLGCGTMGIAILSGILTELADLDAPRPLQVVTSSASVSSLSALYTASQPANGTSSSASASAAAAATEEMPERLPTHFLACVRRPEAAKRLRAALWAHSSVVKVVVDDNVAAVQQAGVVLLACQASEAPGLLASPGMARALQGKLLISICQGVTVAQIEDYLYLHDDASETADASSALTATSPKAEARCCIVRAMPNAASLIGESMTVVDTSSATGPLPAETAALVTWIFRRIGSVVHHPSRRAVAGPGTRALATVDRVAASSAAACTALGTAGPAFFALVLEAAIDGAVAMGLPRAEAQLLAAQSMRGAAGLVLQNGEHPALLRDRVSTPGGCAIQGLLTLEEGGVRSTIARAVREATAVAVQEGK
ncbi:pyrroline-5-carboxylate reductase [Sporothrix schenckii 1099-18]|uniref:Pyrroline-5-carboxylate reductase n=1 Tax=Sporothrix schenckii 1099-18 TaxID=1397361 RepID=A0A0F2MDF3_SPOSC|nr:pyrroline-5-carboxylate reductase [Sporothrix schenckii 1099-18]KJR87114.1 pyrroline-5-carboxylate reductase [Sporothrix schenckii 1099-18]